MRLRLTVVLSLIAVLMAPVAVFAADPLAVPAYELVMFEAGEIQQVGFAAGDVQATVGFFGSQSVPGGSSNVTPPWALVPPSQTVAPAGLFTEGGEGMPGLAEIGDLSEASGNPREFLIILCAFLIALVMGFAVYGATHNSRAGQRGSLLLQSLTSLGVMIFFYVGGGGVIPGWVLIPFGIEALFLLIGRNPQHSST